MPDNTSSFNSNEYDSHITSVLPYYREYCGQIIDLVNATGKKDIKWLDTGCGTGTLPLRVLAERDDVKFTLCDPSGKMLEEAKQKLHGRAIDFINKSSQELDFESEFDVVTAVQCHHYLHPEERRVAVTNCYNALHDGGVFVAFENVKMTTDESEKIALQRWAKYQADHERSDDEIKEHLGRRGVNMFPVTVEEHIKLLREVGFKSADILWTAYLQAGIWAIK